MNFSPKKQFDNFLNNSKNYPILGGFISGFYPLVFFYSNNFTIINSWKHLLFFSVLFVVVPIIIVYLGYKILNKSSKYSKYKKQFLFISILWISTILLSFVYYHYIIKKKIILGAFIVIFILSFKLYNQYKKIIVFLILLSIVPLLSLSKTLLNLSLNQTLSWTKFNDKIESTKFKKTPNIYFIEPDGYVGQQSMKKLPYNYNSDLYNWLKLNNFKLYNSYSNYPASLASNASMFAMKHHYLKQIPSSNFEMENAREIIVGNNSVINILKNNNYKTYFIVEDDYFQQNLAVGNYDYYNIRPEDISLISDGNLNKRDVFSDFKNCMKSDVNNLKPKFYFIEKLLPHHIHYDNTGKENERKVYLEKIEQTNKWLKKCINYIESNDPNGIIIIAADHGGWVGIESLDEMFTTNDEALQKSIFSNLLAIKWNDSTSYQYDENLKSNVNIFRVLFANLSKDKNLLNHLEEDKSYRITYNGLFGKKAIETPKINN